MKIKKDIRNDLMNRREVLFETEGEKIPSYPEATKITAEHFKTQEGNVMIEQIKGVFGLKKVYIKASIYSTPELKEDAFKRLTKPKKEKVAN